MSYDIFYDRRFIKVPEHGYIPMVQMGSSNAFEYTYNGREIPEKMWFVLNTINPQKVIFSEEEIMKIAKDMELEAEHGTVMKTRYTSFKPGEITKWFKSGIKNARTLEEYISWGNNLEALIYTGQEKKVLHPATTEELLSEIILQQISGTKINLHFTERNFKVPKTHRKRKDKTLDEYPFVIKTKTGYLHHLGQWKFYTIFTPKYAKKFKTEKEALKYMEKYNLPPEYKVVYAGKKPKQEQLTIFQEF
ncbi:MAG TPA: hypothetical protein GX516_01975 [Thermoanaerobacter sp.]|nr:hypothetical protein [Thermoanaerobacter sp.]